MNKLEENVKIIQCTTTNQQNLLGEVKYEEKKNNFSG